MANELQIAFSNQVKNELDRVKEALPANFNSDRAVTEAWYVFNNNSALQKCNKASVIAGFIKGYSLGLSFADKECYLIPYGSDANFQTDYKGEIKYVKNYSIRPIKDIYAELIREEDEFERTVDENGQHFSFKQKNIGAKIVGVFAVCYYEDGGTQIEVMNMDEVTTVRNTYSKQKNGTPWQNSTGEMIKKVCLRRLCKHINTNFTTEDARKAWEEGSGMEFKEREPKDTRVVDAFDDAIPVDVVEVVEDGTE